MQETKAFLDDLCSMRSISRFHLVFILLFSFVFSLKAQKNKKETDSLELERVKNMVSFFEYMLNTLGSDKTSARDKDVLITESYSKIFRDGKVQVEDDLDEKRDVITNKDITAYLKDVDFFFKDVHFEFIIEDIQTGEATGNHVFYKVSLMRNLKGTTIENVVVNNSMKRFIEINYNDKTQDLKIVSIYTHEFDQTAALTYWWNQMSYEWQSILKRKLDIVDTVGINDLKNMLGIETLDVSHNEYIVDLSPLQELRGLKTLALANTHVTDLSPLRHLTELTYLDLSNTPVTDISALKYANVLTALVMANSRIKNIAVIEKMPQLQTLNLSGLSVADYSPLGSAIALRELNLSSSSIYLLDPLESMTQLEALDLSKTGVINLNTLALLTNLKTLRADSTQITDIHALASLKQLTHLHLNHTLVADLSALQNLPLLERVYCDHTRINRAVAEAFMSVHPQVLIIFDSEDLGIWWKALPAAWKNVFSKSANVQATPTKEELAKVTKLDSINLTAAGNIDALEPLERLHNLRKLVASHTSISDITPLKSLNDLIFLDISDTRVTDLSVLAKLPKLSVLKANRTEVNLNTAWSFPAISKMYFEETPIGDRSVEQWLDAHPSCLVVYQTSFLEKWWASLPSIWKDIFNESLKTINPTAEELHGLIEGERLIIKDVAIDDLKVLRPFIRLKELHISGTAVSDLSPVTQMNTLRSLHATRSPIRVFGELGRLPLLEDLNLADTPLNDLSVLKGINNLKKFDCSGTQLMKLKDLEEFSLLEYLDCSNTAVRNLDDIQNLPLKTLKCFNTKIRDRKIEDYRARHPYCNVVYYR